MAVDEGLPGGRRTLVIDTDPGADDALALALLAAEPTVDILAVGSAHGNCAATVAADNALRVLDLLGLPEVPVAVGAPGPLNGKDPVLAPDVHGADGLGGHAGPSSSRRPSGESAAEQLVRLARRYPGQLTLVALAPLTNIALALDLEPRLPELLRDVVWMGGAVHVPGNMTPHAEANCWNDPEAAAQVLGAGFRLTVVPLDATEQVWAGDDWLRSVDTLGPPAARLVPWISSYVDFCTDERGERGCVLHDPLAAALTIDPALARFESHRLRVELAGERRGAVRPDGAGTVRVAVEVRVEAVLHRMRTALAPHPAVGHRSS